VKIAIKRLTAPAGWWNGSDFTTSPQPVWYEANNNTTPEPDQFVYVLPAGVTTYMTDSGHQNVNYLLAPWAYDNAQNSEYGPAGNAGRRGRYGGGSGHGL